MELNKYRHYYNLLSNTINGNKFGVNFLLV